LAESALIYDWSQHDRREYVSDYVSSYRTKNINPSNDLFDHKLMLRSVLLASGFRQAETVAVIAIGNILAFPFGPDRGYLSGPEFERLLLEDAGRYIVKPEAGTWGRGIFVVETENGSLVRRQGRTTEPFRLPGPKDSLIVERAIRQAEFWRNLFPGTANTIRALTMWTPGEGAPFLGAAVQRIGTADTVPTDNWAGGGICAPVDIATGRLGVGRMHPIKGARPHERFERHPGTGTRIEGELIPHWEAIRDTVVQAATTLPVNRYVGWDVVVDDTGTPVIIEGNGNSDVNLLQIHGGLLTNTKVREFYQAVGVL
jgi:hypothetical protein